MEDELANLHLTDEEEDAFQEDPKETNHHLQFCLVGTCLTDSVVHFPSLQNTMADLWHPIGGIAIIDLGEKRQMERVVPEKERDLNMHNSRDYLSNLGPHSKQGFAAINGGIPPVFNVGIKTGFGSNGIGDNVNGLMDLGSKGESSLILTDERKKCQRTLVGNPQTVHRLRNYLREVRPRILFLMETKISTRKIEGVRRKCGFHNGIEVGAKGSKGGLCLRWKQQNVVTLRSFSHNHIDVEIQDEQDGSLNTRGWNPSSHRIGRRQFQFNADWYFEGDCEKVIRDYWEATSNNLPTKLEGLGKKLLVWNSSVQRNMKVHKQKLVDRMKELHDVEQTDDALVELIEI
ncbi:hypothetical protein Gotri_000796 [Gossypium trilobum]|uniref:Uncharacterized protein n=1 Tax=Gossypium trilobum TaxID=34281 RepID=A0A7J9FCL3_9ROSI|nr:hypothetical protein [Gossypium trilobum]